MSRAILPFTLVAIAALLFAVSEFVATFILGRFSLDLYVISRLIVAIVLTVIAGAQFSRVIHVALTRREIYFRAAMWLMTVLFLAISFKYSTSQTAAYVCFMLHPIWAVMINYSWYGKIPRRYISVSISLLAMIIGVGLFVYGDLVSHVESSEPLRPALMTVYALSFIAGVAFALGNAYTGHILSDHIDTTISPAELHLSTYTLGLAFLPFVYAMLWAYQIPFFDFRYDPVIAPSEKHLIFADVSASSIGGMTSIFILLLIGAIAALANKFLADGIHLASERNKGIVTALELLSIPLVVSFEFFLINPPLALPSLSAFGLALIVAGAFLITALCSEE